MAPGGARGANARKLGDRNPHPKERTMKLLLPIDGSERALEAVHLALRMVRGGLRADIVLANVQAPPSLYEVVVAHDAEVIREVSEAAAAHSLEAAQVLLRTAGVPHTTEVDSGDPGHVIAEMAERLGCDMLILGSHDSGALRGATLGTVAAALVHLGKWPVLIAGPPEA